MEFTHSVISALAPFTIAIFAFWPVYFVTATINALDSRSFSRLPSHLFGLWITLLLVRLIAAQATTPNPFAALMQLC